MISDATKRRVLQLRSEGRSYTEIERSTSISRPTVANIISGQIQDKEPGDKFKKVRAKRCPVCYHFMKIWSTDKDQCWACTVREGCDGESEKV